MAIKFNRSQTFATNGTVTAAALHNLIDGTDIYQALITDQTAMTSVGSLDKLLIADSDLTAGDAPRSVTVNELFEDALTLSTYTNVKATNAAITTGTIATGTFGTTTSTAATITAGTIATGTFGTTTSTAATITAGTITTGVIPTGTFGTTTSTAATITTGTIPTLTSITKITSGTGTAAAPAISPTGDTNTGIFFPLADTVAFSEGGTEAMRIDSNGNVGIGVTSIAAKLNVYDASSATIHLQGDSTTRIFTQRASADATSPDIDLRKSRGSIASPAAVATGDFLGFINFQAFGGTLNRILSRIYGQVETYVSDTNISSNLVFQTSPAGSAAATEKLRIGPDGQIGIGGANYGTSGQVLTSNGSAAAPSWQASLGITSGTAVTSTSGTAIDFTSIPSTAKRITVMLSGVRTTGTFPVLIQLGSTTFATSGYAGGGSFFTSDVNTSATNGILYEGYSTTNATRHGSMQIQNFSGNTWVGSAIGNWSDGYATQGNGSVTLSGTLDRIRITTNSANTFNLGSINIMYEG